MITVPILHHRGPADHFQVCNPNEIVQNLILHPSRKVSVFFVRTNILERQHGDTVLGSRLFVLRKKLAVLLHRLFPRWYLPLYTMIEFTRLITSSR